MNSGASPLVGDSGSETTPRVRERLARAAFAEFGKYGFDNTTVDQISEAAGLSRRTFFRYFQTKEDVIFPEHDRLRELVGIELDRRTDEPALEAVCDSIELVLEDYVRNRDVSLARFALTRSVVTLRDREVTSVHRYQRLFARYLRERRDDLDALTVEIMAAAIVAAHNSVLRDWLVGGGIGDPMPELGRALAVVRSCFSSEQPPTVDPAGAAAGVGVAVFSLDASMPDVVNALQALKNPGTPTPTADTLIGLQSRRRPADRA